MTSQKTNYSKNKLRKLGFVSELGLELIFILGSIAGLLMAQYVKNISFTANVYFES